MSLNESLIGKLEEVRSAISNNIESVTLQDIKNCELWEGFLDEAISFIRQHIASTTALKSGDINAPENESSIGYGDTGRTAAPDVVERVAIALADFGGKCQQWAAREHENKEYWRNKAKAAMAAMEGVPVQPETERHGAEPSDSADSGPVQQGDAPIAESPSAKSSEISGNAREMFEAWMRERHPGVELDRDRDAWNREKYKHSHVKALYDGFEGALSLKPVSVSLGKCASEGMLACQNFYNAWDGKDAMAVHKHVAKAILETAGVAYVEN